MLNTILGLLGWLGTALVLAGTVARFLQPDLIELRYWLLGSGLVCVSLYALSDWRKIFRLFDKRQARYGALTTTSILLVLGILVAINYLLAQQNKRWDLTAAQQYSLSDQTKRFLANLEAPVNVLVFGREDEFPRYRDRLEEYTYESEQVSVEYIDVDRQPLIARQYQIQSYGTIVFEYQGRIERTLSDTEQDLTNTLVKAVEGEEQKVYFLQGHGEKEISSSDRDGYSGITDSLSFDNFSVESIVLAQEGRIPDDAAVLIVAGPTTDLLATETDAIQIYLQEGGKALFLVDPPATSNTQELTNITGLLREWAIEIGNNIVVDASGVGQLFGTDATWPIAANYPLHPITEQFGLLTAYPLARSVEPISGGVEGRFAQPFIETSPRSWAEANLELASGEVTLDETDGDVAGPITIAAAVATSAPEPRELVAAEGETPQEEEGENIQENETSTSETRVAVIGDSDFVANYALGTQGNRDMFLNTVNWLAQQENLIAIRPRDPEDRRVTLTTDEHIRILWIVLLLVPGGVLSLGIYTWWGRR